MVSFIAKKVCFVNDFARKFHEIRENPKSRFSSIFLVMEYVMRATGCVMRDLCCHVSSSGQALPAPLELKNQQRRWGPQLGQVLGNRVSYSDQKLLAECL